MSENAFRTSISQRFTPKERKTILVLGDILVVSIALVIALITWAHGDDWLGLSPEFFAERTDSWFYLLPFLWLLMIFPTYDLRRASSVHETLRWIGIVSLICLGGYLLIFFLAPPNALPRRGVAVFFVCTALLSVVWRMLYIKKFTVPEALMNTLIVGAGISGTRMAEIINSFKPLPFRVVGFIDDDPAKLDTTIHGYPVLGNSSQFFDMVEKYHITQIVMAITNQLDPQMFEALTVAEERGLIVTTMPKVYEELLGRVPVFLLNTDWMLRSFYDTAHASPFFEIMKRLFDIIGGILGTIIMALIFPFTALAILIDTGRPVFYSQERLGILGSTFKIIKFRTMVQNAEKDGIARPASDHDSRITKVGNFLRRSHLDEMPQFINVLRGDLSLVGPRAERPAIVEDLQREIPFYRGRLLVRPGITGWAQVNYGYASGTEQNAIKLEYDLYYIKHRTLFMDLSILISTIRTIVGLKGR